MHLVQSNPDSVVEETTRRAFAILDPKDPVPSLKILTELKGIGPATASLFLSALEEDEVPFFSDDLFRWVMWDVEVSEFGGWKRMSKYNVKEYETVVKELPRVKERLGVRAVDCEKVAWVLGKENADIDAGTQEGEAEGAEEIAEKAKGGKGKSKKTTSTPQKPKEKKKDANPSKAADKANDPKRVAKRKADSAPSAVEGTRRSSRRRTEVEYAE